MDVMLYLNTLVNVVEQINDFLNHRGLGATATSERLRGPSG